MSCCLLSGAPPSRRPSGATWAVALALAALADPGRAQAPPEHWDYRIERGDTLIGLKARWMRPDADWRVVQKLNRVADPRRLRPGATLRIPLALLREEPLSAEVLHAHGEVFVERLGAAREPLRPAAALRAGDVISTGPQSSVSVRFADGSSTLLGPDGRLRVERHARLGASGITDMRLQLDGGGVESRVVPARPAPRFELRTPQVNLGVRGTEFRGRVDGARVLVEVLEGRVAAGAQLVDAGSGTVAAAGGVAPVRALPAPPDLAALPSRAERLPLQLAFRPSPGAARYRAQLFDTGEPGQLLLEGVFDQPVASWPLTPADGRYELRVRAADADGVEGRAARQVFEIKARPEPPFMLKPRAGDRLQEERVAFAWSRHPEAARYKLQVSANADFSAPLVDRDDLGANDFDARLPVGRYVWRVASVRASGDAGPWGDGSAFDRVEPPPPPAAPSSEPPRPTDKGLVLHWARVAQPGVRYQLQVARDAAFAQTVVDETTDATEWLLAEPAPGVYHVRVRSVGADGRAGAFGTAQQVEVPRSMWWLWLLPLLLLL